MDYQALADELLAGHPVTGAYAADNGVALTQLNVINRTVERTSMSGDEVFTATDDAEFIGLTDHKQLLWLSFCGRDIDPFNQSNIDFLDHVFGTSSTTKTTLASLRTTAVSRATELGFGNLRIGDLEYARTL